MPFAGCLKQKFFQRNLLHADETTITVLHEPGKKPTTKAYITDVDNEKTIVLFNYYNLRGVYHTANI